MSTAPHDPRHVHLTDPQAIAPPDDYDPAHAELSGALRKSFRVLKVVMFVLVVLYFLSGWFSVKPSENGVVLRFGEIVGAKSQDAIKRPGWHWSLPFPIDSWYTVSVAERELPVEFMLQLTPEEEASGRLTARFANLAPERDDYLVTGDVNILHAKLIIKYKIDNVVDYVTNVMPSPSPKLQPDSPAYMAFPEYTLLRCLARNAVIETVARFGALDVRGSRQDDFLVAVAAALNRRLKQLDDAGTPLGLLVDPNSGVIATKSKTGSLEAIMPPRQTQEVFDQVFAAQTNKVVTITKAKSEAESRLVNTAGPDYGALADAVEAEFDVVRKLSAAENEPERSSLASELKTRRQTTEDLLLASSGEIRSIIKNAEIDRDKVLTEATGDYNRYAAILPEYLRNREIFISRTLDELQARALSTPGVMKVYVPREALQYRLQIPRSTAPVKTEEQKNLEKKMKQGGRPRRPQADVQVGQR